MRLRRRPPVVEHRRTPNHHTTVEGCAMAVLHSSRARKARGDLQTYLSPTRASRVPSSGSRIDVEHRSMHCVRVRDLDRAGPDRASRAQLMGQATLASLSKRTQQFRAEERHLLSALRSPLGPCPCDRCPHAAMCCDLQLACRAFGQFVRGVQWRGTARKPTHARYLRVFGSKG
jgi:hypothetical protein